MKKSNNKYILSLILLIASITCTQAQDNTTSKQDFKSFVALFPEEYLPFSISENELYKFDKSDLKPIPEQYNAYFLNLNNSEKVSNYALAFINIDNGKKMIFHLEEMLYPLQRKVYVTVFSKEGFAESSVLFAAYSDGVQESFTYAVINLDKQIYRTIKSFDNFNQKVNIKTEKFRLNTIGEIVAL